MPRSAERHQKNKTGCSNMQEGAKVHDSPSLIHNHQSDKTQDPKKTIDENRGNIPSPPQSSADGNLQSSCENRGKKSIITFLDNFLQQRSEFDWLTRPIDGFVGSDHFHNLVVRSTFPADLDQNSFGDYIDMTFNDFPSSLRTKMKHLFRENNRNATLEDVIIATNTNSTASATLIQIVMQNNDRTELEMLVGSISFTRQAPQGYQYTARYWEQHKGQVQRALQYIYGKEAKKQLSNN